MAAAGGLALVGVQHLQRAFTPGSSSAQSVLCGAFWVRRILDIASIAHSSFSITTSIHNQTVGRGTNAQKSRDLAIRTTLSAADLTQIPMTLQAA
jgi:hypothetical protein